MKRDDRLQPPVDVGPIVRVNYADEDDPEVEAAIYQWLRSLLDSPRTPDEARGS